MRQAGTLAEEQLEHGPHASVRCLPAWLQCLPGAQKIRAFAQDMRVVPASDSRRSEDLRSVEENSARAGAEEGLAASIENTEEKRGWSLHEAPVCECAACFVAVCVI